MQYVNGLAFVHNRRHWRSEANRLVDVFHLKLWVLIQEIRLRSDVLLDFLTSFEDFVVSIILGDARRRDSHGLEECVIS